MQPNRLSWIIMVYNKSLKKFNHRVGCWCGSRWLVERSKALIGFPVRPWHCKAPIDSPFRPWPCKVVVGCSFWPWPWKTLIGCSTWPWPCQSGSPYPLTICGQNSSSEKYSIEIYSFEIYSIVLNIIIENIINIT